MQMHGRVTYSVSLREKNLYQLCMFKGGTKIRICNLWWAEVYSGYYSRNLSSEHCASVYVKSIQHSSLPNSFIFIFYISLQTNALTQTFLPSLLFSFLLLLKQISIRLGPTFVSLKSSFLKS